MSKNVMNRPCCDECNKLFNLHYLASCTMCQKWLCHLCRERMERKIYCVSCWDIGEDFRFIIKKEQENFNSLKASLIEKWRTLAIKETKK